MASLREYDHAGVATNTANDYRAGEVPTYFSALQAAGYHTMTTGKDDLTKATSLGYTLGYDTRNASATYHAAALGFSDSIRFEGKENVINTYPTPHEPYGYHLNASEVPLANGSRVNAFRAHRACLIGGPDRDLCQRDTYPADLYEDDWTAAQAVSLLERAPHEKPYLRSDSNRARFEHVQPVIDPCLKSPRGQVVPVGVVLRAARPLRRDRPDGCCRHWPRLAGGCRLRQQDGAVRAGRRRAKPRARPLQVRSTGDPNLNLGGACVCVLQWALRA